MDWAPARGARAAQERILGAAGSCGASLAAEASACAARLANSESAEEAEGRTASTVLASRVREVRAAALSSLEPSPSTTSMSTVSTPAFSSCPTSSFLPRAASTLSLSSPLLTMSTSSPAIPGLPRASKQLTSRRRHAASEQPGERAAARALAPPCRHAVYRAVSPTSSPTLPTSPTTRSASSSVEAAKLRPTKSLSSMAAFLGSPARVSRTASCRAGLPQPAAASTTCLNAFLDLNFLRKLSIESWSREERMFVRSRKAVVPSTEATLDLVMTTSSFFTFSTMSCFSGSFSSSSSANSRASPSVASTVSS